MTGLPAADDLLARWLAGERLAALDDLTGEAQDYILVLDRELTVRYINRADRGLPRENLVGRNILELVRQDSREKSRNAYADVLRTGNAARFEAIYKDSDELSLWDVRVGPIRFESEVIGLIVTTSDVTEQRRADADRDRFFSLSLDMLIVSSPDGHFKRVNPAFGETLGYDAAELIGTHFVNLVHPDDRARSHEAFDSALGGARVLDFENRYRRRDGEYRVFSWRATADPVTRDVYSVARDITDHRATEAQLRHAQKMEAVGQLAGGVAHDFNNLLLAILANAELALRSMPRPSEIAEHLSEIELAAQRAADLTKQLLAFSRRQPLRPVPVDLNDLTRGLMRMVRRLLPENIGIESISGHELASVNADPGQLEQVIVNLCVNARDAMERGGRLTIETKNVSMDGHYCETHPWARPGRYVLLRVTDTGAGMTAVVRERAFEPFFTTKGAQRGTGLGLSTVYGIVQQHGGMVHIYSELGEGTTFKVFFPSDSRLATDVGDKIEPMPPGGRETILLAEDEERVRKVIVQLLERAGYRTIAASNGREAIRLLREHKEPVHLVLLDVIMPELGGPETWEQMRGMGRDLRVLFMSGYADDRFLARLPPDAEVIGKPFRTEELLSRIRRKLDDKP
jgi:two-component system, cell cycle sensor histidine kinase and response regulator CckA